MFARFTQISILFLLTSTAWGQLKGSDIIASVEKYRKETDAEFANIHESPLPIFRTDEFTTLPYFDIDTNCYVAARLVLSDEGRPFKMKTTTERVAEYKVYGVAHFTLGGTALQLTIYESIPLRDEEKHLFLPFMDKTNGEETYGGGRYVEVDYPTSDTLFIDFNKAYNPYCAYNDGYSCPLVPSINRLDVPIRAGVKYEKHDENWGKVDQQASYPGGTEELFKTLYANLVYPNVRERLDVTVYVSLLLEKDGQVSKRTMLKGYNYLVDTNALKATEALGAFIPAMKDGKPVRSQVVLPIRVKK